MLPPRRFWKRFFKHRGVILVMLAIGFLSPAAALAVPPGTVITNQAQLGYLDGNGTPVTLLSNAVDVVTTVSRTPSGLQLARVLPAGIGDYDETVGPSACLAGGTFASLADPVVLGGSVIDPAQAQALDVATIFNLGEPVFLRLADADQNLDAAAVEYVVADVSHTTSGDTEAIRLTETGPDTGVFTGHVPTAGGGAASGDCVLQGAANSSLAAAYADPADAADTAAAVALLDPINRVFESRSGAPVNGASIAIVDALSGLPATVFGNDGASAFPSVITSGSTVTDGAGVSYAFGPGEYRFPVVASGSYRLVVTPPGTYAAPSAVAEAELQSLPGAPFALGQASFGAAFTAAGPVLAGFDIPLDPVDGSLYLQKTTLTGIAAPGDFLRFQLSVANTAASGTATNARVVDQLPAEMRYVAGSAQRDGADTADPVISADARRLDFAIGDLPAGERAELAYVVQVIGGERNREIVNTATAGADAGLSSNVAAAKVMLTEDLFRSTSTLIGRVVDGHCSQATFGDDAGVGGIRVFLEDGRFAVSDENGRFHFEGLAPGTHVAQLDPDSVPNWYEVVGCNTAPQFSGRHDSQFVRTSRGSLVRADFYLRRKRPPEGQVDIQLRNHGTESTEKVRYVVNLNGEGNVPVRNLQVTVLLPDGVSFLPGTLQVDGETVPDPRITGPAITAGVAEQFGNWASELAFFARIASDTHGELTTKALAKFDSPVQAGQQTPVVETRMSREKAVLEDRQYVVNLTFETLSAELSPQDRDQLLALAEEWQGVRDIRIAAVGHSDNQQIAPHNRGLFANNYVLSSRRALAAATFLADALNVDSTMVTVEGRGADLPIARNSTEAGRRANRRVELRLSGTRPTRPSFLEVTQAISGVVIASTQGAIPGMEETSDKSLLELAFEDDAGLPSGQIEAPLAALQPGIELLLPAEGFHPSIPSTKISVKHRPGQSVRVELNGRPVNPLNFDGSEVTPDQAIAVSRWKGVDLADGENSLRIKVTEANGAIAAILERDIVFSGTAVRGEVVPELSVLVADGKTRPVIAVRLYDRAGNVSRQGAVGSFRIEAPYRSWWEVEFERKNKIVAVGDREPVYRVGQNGIALIELEPTTQAGEAKLTLNFDNRRQQEMRAWLSSQPRDWIMVGFAEGTAGYNTLSKNMTAATRAGFDDGYFDDGRVAFFAKGQIKGEYLLTMAYDSDRDRGASPDRFESPVDPNAYYGLYADKSEQRYDAASQRRLYLKIERRQFFAMFGDYDTGLNVTELSRYERRFSGLKSGFRGDNLSYTAFATETNQAFVRDEIRGDGTSGLYRLTNAPVIFNSEQIRIEVRDRFDTGEVLASSTLSRFLDYTLDPSDGTLYFRQPVPSRDAAFNPVFIVAEYESASEANDEMIAGGRVAVGTRDEAFEIGITYIDENRQGAGSDLTGVDVRWRMDAGTLLKAEVATSNRTAGAVDEAGSAMSLTLEHQSEAVDVRAYLQEVDQEFGLGQQNSAEKGIRKLGIDGRARVSTRFYVDGEASWQQNLETDAIRTAARAQVRYESEGFTATGGLLHAADKFEDGETRQSDLAELGISRNFGPLLLRANSSFELSDPANADYPHRLVFGADYKMYEGVKLFAEYEEASGAQLDASMTRLGVRATPWARAQLNSSITNQETEFGPRLFSNVGLVQGFKLSEHWVLDVGLDQANTLTGPDLRQFDEDRELASGSFNDDFLAAFVGASYTAELWTANSRLEYRNSDNEKRKSLLSGWYREPALGHGLSAGLNVFTAKSLNGNESAVVAFKFGWAWRRADSRWSFLNRTDVVSENETLAHQEQQARRIVNNFNANLRISARAQLSLQYAMKLVGTSFDDKDYSGYTDLIGLDFRRSFKRKWDWGAHTSIHHVYSTDSIDYGIGLDVGYNLRDNLWISLGYNVAGFHDADFAQARYTAQGPYLQIAMKTDQHALRAIANR